MAYIRRFEPLLGVIAALHDIAKKYFYVNYACENDVNSPLSALVGLFSGPFERLASINNPSK
jgi:hypothetical protein